MIYIENNGNEINNHKQMNDYSFYENKIYKIAHSHLMFRWLIYYYYFFFEVIVDIYTYNCFNKLKLYRLVGKMFNLT